MFVPPDHATPQLKVELSIGMSRSAPEHFCEKMKNWLSNSKEHTILMTKQILFD